VADQAGAAACPQCGSKADVRTVRELFDIMNAGGAQAFQRFNERSGGPNADDDNYNHYNVEGSRSRWRSRRRRGKKWERAAFAADLLSDPSGAVVDVALEFAGRAIARRAKQVVNEQVVVVPGMQAKAARAQAAQAEQQFAQAQVDQDAIVARYPELRACMKDQVVFLDGGSRAVLISEIPMPVTVPQADAVVARLR
jgi:hypothetical protein